MIIISAGSNLPFCGIDSQQLVSASFSAIAHLCSEVIVSPLYKTPAWPDPADPGFINGVALVQTPLSPSSLLAALHGVETAFGRVRGRKNAPRTLDLDLIAYGDVVRPTGPGPVLPHPRLETREFVLAPMVDVAPDWHHPVTKQSIASLLEGIEKRQAVRIC